MRFPGFSLPPWTGRCARATIPRPLGTSQSRSWGRARVAGPRPGTDGVAADTPACAGLRYARAADAHPLLAPEVRREDRRPRERGDPREVASLFGGARRVE